jgi:hypothetical protein
MSELATHSSLITYMLNSLRRPYYLEINGRLIHAFGVKGGKVGTSVLVGEVGTTVFVGVTVGVVFTTD